MEQLFVLIVLKVTQLCTQYTLNVHMYICIKMSLCSCFSQEMLLKHLVV